MPARAAIFALGVLMLTLFSGSVVLAQSARGPVLVSLDLRTHRQHVFRLRSEDYDLSSDRHAIAYVVREGNTEYQLRTSQLDGSNDRLVVRTPFPSTPIQPRWAPDGHAIAYAAPPPACPTAGDCLSTWIVRAAGGKPARLSDRSGAAAWAPGSHRLAFPGDLDVTGQATLTIQNEDGSGRKAIGGHRSINALSWSQDGRKVVYSTHSRWDAQPSGGRIHVVTVATGNDTVVASGYEPAWSHDSKLLSFAHWRKGRTGLYVLRGRRRRLLMSRRNWPYSAVAQAWSRTGHRLAFATGRADGQARVYVFDADSSAPPRPATRWRSGAVPFIAWSPDARRLLFERKNS